jgi:hypothetical protein
MLLVVSGSYFHCVMIVMAYWLILVNLTSLIVSVMKSIFAGKANNILENNEFDTQESTA